MITIACRKLIRLEGNLYLKPAVIIMHVKMITQVTETNCPDAATES